MATYLQVVGPLATPYLEDGTRAYLYEGAFLPAGLREGEDERMLDLGLVEEVEVDDVEPDPEDEDAEGGPTTVKGILAEVGEDKDKAAAALEAERAGENRSTLISKLEAILTAGS